MSKSKEILVGLFVLIGIVCLAYLTIKMGRMELGRSSGYELVAKFSSVNGLRTGAEVEIAGVRIGRVIHIGLDKDGVSALVTLRVNHDVKLTDDVIASIKTAGLIGDKYIDLAPGGNGEPLKAGDMIEETQPAIDIEELISKYVFGKV